MSSPVIVTLNILPSSDSHGVPNRIVSVQEEKLRKSAAEFEAILISTFWKSMKDSFASDEDASDPAHSTFEDMGIQAMAGAMSRAGGLGLGKLILKHLEPVLEASGKTTATPKR